MISNIQASAYILFQNNPGMVSSSQTAGDFDKYYGQYLQVEDKTAKEFREEIFQTSERITCTTYSNVSIFDTRLEKLEKPLVIINRILDANGLMDRSVAFLFIIDRSEIYNLLFQGGQEENLSCIIDGKGEMISAFGKEAAQLSSCFDQPVEKGNMFQISGADYYVQKAKDSIKGNTILLAVPTKQIQISTIRLLSVNLVVLVLSIIISAVTLILYTYYRSVSIQGLLDHINEHSKAKFVTGNEYQFIRENVGILADSRDAYRKELDNLRIQMNNNMLEQMFLQETTSVQNQEICKKFLPKHMEYFYVLVIQCQEEDSDMILNAFYALERYAGEFIHGEYLSIQTAVNEKSFLVRMDQKLPIEKWKGKERLERLQQKVTEELKVIFHAGVSGIGMDFVNIHSCYIQAKQALTCYTREHMNTIGYYSDLLDTAGDNLMNMDFISKLYQYLLSGKKESFMEALDKLLRHYRVNPELYERSINGIYYSIRYTIVCAAIELSFSEKDLQIENWNSSRGFSNGIEILRKAAQRLLEINEDHKRSHNNVLKENIIHYIDEYFADPNLTASMVCQDMKISEKYLTQFLKEQTGMTFAKYVEELRIEKAKELLNTTDDSNERIAKAVGFGSLNSFYRVFHKKTGVSPGAYRKK